ncbi:cytochrome c3 family protein [Novipirellula rosea]|uniref:cytochrome c3 family protein n=1 Tax=Novipirellula rosea TaxID=1031540 RepID=UPI0031E6E6F6
MPQIFSKSADTIFRSAIVASVLSIGAVGGAMLVIARSSYVTGQHIAVTQEVPFSHQHHVADIGIDCRYCHQNVETSPRAGLPTTQVCINCHRKLFNQTDLLAPVRASLREGKPLHWNRVHDLPDYVYFNHSIHVHKGIACYECHGNVGEMPLIMQAQPLTMQWCLDCHRDPQQHVRPRELVFEPQPLEKLVANPNVLRKELAEEYELTSRTDCYTCHR